MQRQKEERRKDYIQNIHRKQTIHFPTIVLDNGRISFLRRKTMLRHAMTGRHSGAHGCSVTILERRINSLRTNEHITSGS